MRVSIAFSYSAAVMTTLRERATPTLIGSNVRPMGLDFRLEEGDPLGDLRQRSQIGPAAY